MVNLVLAPTGVWATIINWFNSFIPSFGWTIVVFTIILKIVLSPLDVWQRVLTKKNTEKQLILQPELEKLQKKYGNNKEQLNQKTMELYKKNNYNITGSCLGIFINLVITLVIFITLFSSLNAISQSKISTEYNILQEVYTNTLKIELENSSNLANKNELSIQELLDDIYAEHTQEEADTIKAEAQGIAKNVSLEKYNEIRENFLWIKNVYRPDTYASVFPSANDYINISGTKFNPTQENPFIDIYGNSYTDKDEAKQAFINNFEEVTENINKSYAGWNGYLILVALAALVTLGSQFVTQMNNKKKITDKKGNEIEAKTPSSNKLLMFLLPVLMIFFTLQYSSAFALYIVFNSLMSVLIGFITNLVLMKMDKKKEGA